MSWDPENRKGEGKIRELMKEQETAAQKLPLCGTVFPLSLDRMGNGSCKGGAFCERGLYLRQGRLPSEGQP